MGSLRKTSKRNHKPPPSKQKLQNKPNTNPLVLERAQDTPFKNKTMENLKDNTASKQTTKTSIKKLHHKKYNHLIKHKTETYTNHQHVPEKNSTPKKQQKT